MGRFFRPPLPPSAALFPASVSQLVVRSVTSPAMRGGVRSGVAGCVVIALIGCGPATPDISSATVQPVATSPAVAPSPNASGSGGAAGTRITAAAADPAVVARRAWERGLAAGKIDVPAGRRWAAYLNDRGRRHAANDVLRKILGVEPLSIRELNGLAFPLSTFKTFDEKPDVSDPESIRRAGPLSVAAALRSRGEYADAMIALSHADRPEERVEVAAERAWLATLRGNEAAAAEALEAAGAEGERLPAYWLAQGELARRRGDAGSAGLIARAVRLEPAALESWDALIASMRRSAGGSGRSDTPDRSEASDNADHQTDGRDADRGLSAITPAALRLAERHRMKLRKTIALIRGLNGRTSQPVRDANDLAKLLGEVGRPLEAAGWKEAVMLRTAPDPVRLTQIGRYKQVAASRMPGGFDPRRLLAGLSVERWPASRPAVGSAGPDASAGRPYDPADPSGHHSPLAPLAWKEIAADVGLVARYRNAEPPIDRQFRLFEPFGGGVAVLDFDRDGRPDVMAGQAGVTYPNDSADVVDLPGGDDRRDSLFRNVGDRFVEVGGVAIPSILFDGYTIGIGVGDLNQDGFDDIVVANHGPNRYWINRGDGTFRPAAGIDAVDAMTLSIGVADLSGDNIPDVYEVNYVDDPEVNRPVERRSDGRAVSLPGPLHYDAAVDHALLSDAAGRWERSPVPAAATGMGVLIADLHPAAGREVFVANDQMPNQLWSFRREASSPVDLAPAAGLDVGGGGKAMACMGVATLDWPGADAPALHVTNFTDQPSHLFIPRRGGVFVDAAGSTGLDVLSHDRLGFGTQSIDVDLDGAPEIVVANGHVEDFTAGGQTAFRMRPQVLRRSNERGRPGGRWVEASPVGAGEFWGSRRLGRAVARWDWDGDGDDDLLWADLERPLALLDNRRSPTTHSIQLVVVDRVGPRHPVGASVTIVGHGGESLGRHHVVAGDGFACRNQPLVTVGLGLHEGPVDVAVTWPDGGVQTFAGLAVDRRYLLVRNHPDAWLFDDPRCTAERNDSDEPAQRSRT